jgi:hypothetical protein
MIVKFNRVDDRFQYCADLRTIDQLTCPLSIALVISAARNRPSQKGISYQLNSGQAPTKASNVPRHIAISCRMPAQAA